MKQLKELAKASLQSYYISSNNTNVNVISFAKKSKNIWSVKDTQTIKAVQSAIYDIGKETTKADFAQVIKQIQSIITENALGQDKNILLLFTQGSSIDGSQLVDIGKMLPGFETIVVSIGDPYSIFNGFDIKIIKNDENELPKTIGDIEEAVSKVIGE